MLNDKGESCYKNLDVPYVSILLDAPYNPTIGNILFNCKNHFICVLDKSHLSLIDELFPQKKFIGKMFLPLAGMAGGVDDDIFLGRDLMMYGKVKDKHTWKNRAMSVIEVLDILRSV